MLRRRLKVRFYQIHNTAEIEAAPKAVPAKVETPADTLVELETIESSQPAKESVSDVPSEYRSALRSAESYSDRMHMSKAGIYDQLTSEYGEKFTTTEANYAIQNLPQSAFILRFFEHYS